MTKCPTPSPLCYCSCFIDCEPLKKHDSFGIKKIAFPVTYLFVCPSAAARSLSQRKCYAPLPSPATPPVSKTNILAPETSREVRKKFSTLCVPDESITCWRTVPMRGASEVQDRLGAMMRLFLSPGCFEVNKAVIADSRIHKSRSEVCTNIPIGNRIHPRKDSCDSLYRTAK